MEQNDVIRGVSRKRTGGSFNRTKITRIIILAVAEIIVLAGIFSYAYVLKQYNKIQRPEVNIEAIQNENLSLESIQKMQEGYWNIAVFGVDSRDSSVGKGANSDVIIICSINRDTGDIRLVSVFRDTYLKIADDSYNKINAAYCNGGPEQALKALNENLDLNITQYITFNWKAVATVINILGGVDVELSKAEFHYINSYITATVQGTGIGSTQLKQAGMNHLDGVQAVAYARLRYMDNDYARTERQRKIIQLCLEKAKQTDLKTLNSMIGVVLEMVATNMTWQDGLDAVANVSKYDIVETGGFPFARGEADIGKRGDCVVPQTLESNVRELHRFLFAEEEYQPSEAVKNISASIAAASGMYNEGENVGHVSTDGVIMKTSSGEGSEKKDSEETQDGKKASGSQLTKPDDDLEYAISRDGYLIYVDGFDNQGNKKYKYVLDDDGKRIKMIETDENGNTIYLYEVDEDGNFYFGDSPSGRKNPQSTPSDTTQNQEGPVTGIDGGPGVTPGQQPETTAGTPKIPETTSAPVGPGADGPGGQDVPAGPGVVPTPQPEVPQESPQQPAQENPQQNPQGGGPGEAPQIEPFPG